MIFEDRIIEKWHPELNTWLKHNSFRVLKKGDKFRIKEDENYITIGHTTEFVAANDAYLVRYEDIGHTYKVEIEDHG